MDIVYQIFKPECKRLESKIQPQRNRGRLLNMPTTSFRILDNSILVDGLVNGRGIAFIIDTGDAIGPTFNAADAQALGLQSLGPLDVSGAGGSVQIQRTEADITLGGSTFRSESGAIDPDLNGPSLLGLPFFLRKGGTLSFNFDTGILSFGPTSSKKHSTWNSLKAYLGLRT